MRKIKLHAFTFKDLGRAMHNIVKFLIKYKPPEIEIVDRFDDCDVTMEHTIGDHWASPFSQDKALSSRIAKKPFIILWHCFGCRRDEAPGNDFFNWCIDNAKFIYSPWPFDWWGFPQTKNRVRGPWGYDQDVFKNDPAVSKIPGSIMSTGYVSATECFEELYEAAKKAKTNMYHVGKNFRWEKPAYNHFENVTDQFMAELYQKSQFVSGLRRGEGFEIPVLEGAACGCRPIVFENPHYDWWPGITINIPETSYDDVRLSLYNIMMEHENPAQSRLNAIELARIREYGWDIVAKNFWSRFLERW